MFVFKMIGAIVMMCWALPAFIVVVLVIGCFYYTVQVTVDTQTLSLNSLYLTKA